VAAVEIEMPEEVRRRQGRKDMRHAHRRSLFGTPDSSGARLMVRDPEVRQGGGADRLTHHLAGESEPCPKGKGDPC
jgi:hypothetical protein